MKLVFQEDKEKYVNETYARMLSLSTVLRTTSLKKKKSKFGAEIHAILLLTFGQKRL